MLIHPYNQLLQGFQSFFPASKSKWLVRVPGRVNLIGEHTDYNGLPVMPMAIEREVRVVVAPRTDGVVRIQNNQTQFGFREFDLAADIPPYETGDWGNYVKAGVQGAVELASNLGVPPISGFDALIDSNLPMAAGLSSSSATVVASALACMAANNMECDRTQLAEQMAAAERYVGTMGGGMDQAAVLLAKAGAAVKIDFFPVRTKTVALPADYSVVICNSLVIAPKTESARLNYNRRPIECRLAASLLATYLATDVNFDRSSSGNTSSKPLNQQKIHRLSELLAYVSSTELLSLAAKYLGEQPWTKIQSANKLGVSVDALNVAFFTMRDGQILPEFPDGMPLLDRVRHVLTEGNRVEESIIALQNADVDKFGAFMNASHASCRDQYGISCPELEKLVSVARDAGSVGSRLTGAGFGGCTVNLVPNHKLAAFRQSVIAEYYDGYLKEAHPDLHQKAMDLGYDNAIIVTLPCQGAEMLPV